MKFLAVFAALVAVSCASSTWTLQDLTQAIDSQHTDLTLKLHLITALDEMMNNLINGQQIEAVTVTIPSESFTSLSLNELSSIVESPNTNPALLPLYEAALDQMMLDIFSGVSQASGATLVMPAMEIHHYTLHELADIIQDPTTNSMLLPHFETALNNVMELIFAGETMDVIVMAVPIAPVAVVPMPIVPVAVPGEASLPSPPVPAASASPLVQIIVNVNQQA